MALTYDGIKFDTVEELVKYKQLIGEAKPTVSTKVLKKSKIRRDAWTKEDVECVKHYYQKYWKGKRISPKGFLNLGRKLGRTNFAIYKKVWSDPELKKFVQDLKDGKNLRKRKIAKTPVKKGDKRVGRLKFINTRVKSLMDRDPYLSIERARSQASDEYNVKHQIKPGKGKVQKKVPQITKEDLEFPSIFPLSNDGVKTFEQMLIDLMARPDSKIDYLTARNFLSLIPNKEWDGRLWRDFCTQFLLNKKKVCKALNCNESKLKVVVEQGYHIIRSQT